MLVSHWYKFIYTKTVKTASTSVEGYFERFCAPPGEWQTSNSRPEYESATGIIGYRGPSDAVTRKWFNHMPAEAIRRTIGEELWAGYFKFCVIRDPFEKAISAFEHFGRSHVLRRRSFTQRLSGPPSEQDRFLDWLIHQGPPIDRDKYVIGSTICVDDFIRYERLEADTARICARVGVPWERSWFPDHKRGTRRASSTISRLYTQESLQLVANAYAFEIETFGYRIPAL